VKTTCRIKLLPCYETMQTIPTTVRVPTISLTDMPDSSLFFAACHELSSLLISCTVPNICSLQELLIKFDKEKEDLNKIVITDDLPYIKELSESDPSLKCFWNYHYLHMVDAYMRFNNLTVKELTKQTRRAALMRIDSLYYMAHFAHINRTKLVVSLQDSVIASYHNTYTNATNERYDNFYSRLPGPFFDNEVIMDTNDYWSELLVAMNLCIPEAGIALDHDAKVIDQDVKVIDGKKSKKRKNVQTECTSKKAVKTEELPPSPESLTTNSSSSVLQRPVPCWGTLPLSLTPHLGDEVTSTSIVYLIAGIKSLLGRSDKHYSQIRDLHRIIHAAQRNIKSSILIHRQERLSLHSMLFAIREHKVSVDHIDKYTKTIYGSASG
jgi:hypothetical protein